MVFFDLYARAQQITLPNNAITSPQNAIAYAGFLSNAELRLRTLARLQGTQIKLPSGELQREIVKWNRAGNPNAVDGNLRPFFAVLQSKFGKIPDNDPVIWLPALREVIASNEIDYGFTKGHGESALMAAQRFCPSLIGSKPDVANSVAVAEKAAPVRRAPVFSISASFTIAM
jgi:hypothetical protein